MTAGNVPFYSKDQQHMYRKIVQGNLYLPSHFTPELKDLCSNILQVIPGCIIYNCISIACSEELVLPCGNLDFQQQTSFFLSADTTIILSFDT